MDTSNYIQVTNEKSEWFTSMVCCETSRQIYISAEIKQIVNLTWRIRLIKRLRKRGKLFNAVKAQVFAKKEILKIAK